MKSSFRRINAWRRQCGVIAAGILMMSETPLAAMRIVLTNDDGFESANTQALYQALKSAGHEVILSTPFKNLSGSSAYLGVLTDLPRTSEASPGGTIPAGAPGIGPTTLGADQFYVNGSPVAAALYGIDIAAPTKWGAPPDLVISGPNIGNNLGAFTPHSSTIGAAITVLNRGVPAIAVNADSAGYPGTAPLLAAITLRVVAAVTDRGKVTLPRGIGLNVNAPALDLKRTADSYRFAFTQTGTNGDAIRFTVHTGDAPLPGAPKLPADTNPGSESNAIAGGSTVTVTPIQGTYQAAPDQAAQVFTSMRALFSSSVAFIDPQLVNISTRGFVGTGSAVQIVGFVVAGNAPKTLLIRATGPALVAFGLTGVLTDPQLEVVDLNNKAVAANDNWDADPAQATALNAAATRVGAFGLVPGSKDAALLVTLAPGSYTAVVRGVGGTTGVALLEAYDVGMN